MTTVRSLPPDLVPGNEKSTMDLPPSPTNSVPYIIATSADDDKVDKPIVAPVNGGSPVRYLQACSKLDMEPNPFEQSFSGLSSDKPGAGAGNTEGGLETPKPMLPPIASMSGRLAPGNDQFGWDAQSLRMGPLSPSMLEGPQNPIVFDEKSTTQNPLPIGSFPSSTVPMPTIFTSGAPLAENGLPFVGVQGPHPLPAPSSIHTSEPYPPIMYNQGQSMGQHHGGPHGGPGPRPPHPYGPPNGQPMNNRYMPGQGPPPPPPDNGNAFGNLHLLSQAQAAHREMWIKRESTDAGNGHHQQHSHPQQQAHQLTHKAQPHHGPPQSGQSLPGMPGMVAAPQLPKDGVEPSFVRGVRRSRVASEDNSDDSERSKHSSNGGEGTSGSNKKKNGGASAAGDDKMDEEEKRKNFLERNRQAALKCRQRKKQWLSNLQAKVEYLSTDNEHLQAQTAALRDEIIHLKALLLAHKNCPVAQANGVYTESITMPGHGGMPVQGRAPHPMQQPGLPPSQQQQQQQQQQGRGQTRGSLPPPPQHPNAMQHGPMQGGPRMMGQSNPSSGAPVGSMATVAGVGRPMSMMQDITPNASPSQSLASVRY